LADARILLTTGGEDEVGAVGDEDEEEEFDPLQPTVTSNSESAHNRFMTWLP
jgi:hypothetical protein